MIPGLYNNNIITEKSNKQTMVGKVNMINLGVRAQSDPHQVKKYQDEPGKKSVKINTDKIDSYLQNKYGWNK